MKWKTIENSSELVQPHQQVANLVMMNNNLQQLNNSHLKSDSTKRRCVAINFVFLSLYRFVQLTHFRDVELP